MCLKCIELIVTQEDCNYIVRKASDDVCKLSIQFNKFSEPTTAETHGLRGCIDVGTETFCSGDDGLSEGDIRSRESPRLGTIAAIIQ